MKERRERDGGMDALDPGARVSDIRVILLDAPSRNEARGDSRSIACLEALIFTKS